MPGGSWSLSPPPGFQGLRTEAPLTRYVRHLPHWRQDGATYFVTFRLADSLPQEKLHELHRITEQWKQKHALPRSDADWQSLSRATAERVEHWLDQGYGSCLLADASAATVIIESMHHFDVSRYELDCYVVMANHVHVLIKPLQPKLYPLEKILQSWKTFCSREIHSRIRVRGALWQEESFDRIVRNEEHLYRCIQYIGRNPKRARRSPIECHLWRRQEWQQLGWRFDGC
jgi:putative transposase